MEAAISVVTLCGMLLAYGKRKFNKYLLQKQYPKTISSTFSQGDYVVFKPKSYEQLEIISAFYRGKIDLKEWITARLDTDLEFIVQDQTFNIDSESPESQDILHVIYKLSFTEK
jgi:hypothetical protein